MNALNKSRETLTAELKRGIDAQLKAVATQIEPLLRQFKTRMIEQVASVTRSSMHSVDVRGVEAHGVVFACNVGPICRRALCLLC